MKLKIDYKLLLSIQYIQVILPLISTIIMSASEVQKLDDIERMVKQHLALPADQELTRHIAGILLEESPINAA
jgi:hypothetical protein